MFIDFGDIDIVGEDGNLGREEQIFVGIEKGRLIFGGIGLFFLGEECG